MRKRFFLLLSLVLSTLCAFAQQSVSGVVIDENQEAVIGASVVVKGTTNGTITDIDGKYNLSTVPAGSTLVFSYVGMKTQEIKTTPSTSVLNITMKSNAIAIDEVVVTAMGIQQEKKRMNFAVQSVNSEMLTENKSANFVNALQGKIAGLNVTTGSGSPNAGSQIIIRGISSVNTSQSNEPLFIMDGVPISANGSSAADINPNDIENITVLKGAAAAALYGQDAANGVIMITTKRGQAGKVSVTANASWQYDIPTHLQQLQTSYAPGYQGFYKEKTLGGWGPLLNEGETTYDNVGNFLGTGFYQKYDLSLTGGSEKFQAYASANYSKNEGIVPNDYLKKTGVLLKGTFTPIKDLTFTMSANITQNSYRAFGATGMSSVYNWPINDDITNYEESNHFPRHLYYNDIKKYSSPISPLYSRYNDNGETNRLRNIINGQVEWKAFKNFTLTGRVSYDTNSSVYDGYTVPRWDDSVIYNALSTPKPLADGATQAEIDEYDAAMAAYNDYIYKYNTTPYLSGNDIENMMGNEDYYDLLGSYSASSSRSQLFTAGAIATYKLELPNEFSIDFLAGTEMKMSEGFSMSNNGRDFIIPGTYSLSNTNSAYISLTDRTATHSQKRTFGYFGEIRGDYKGIASLSVTSRWDWSSTIISNPFYYPSVTAGLLFSELFDITNSVFSYGKLRGNYALVGKDAPAYLYDRRYKQFATYPDNGYGIDPTLSSANRTLQPEMSSSWEIGADLRFFDSRTRLDIAYYQTQVDNQIVTVRVSPTTGYILQTRNEGNIRNSGIEFVLGQDILKRKDFSWTASLNFGLNRGKVVSLPDGLTYINGTQYGDIFTSAYAGGSTTGLTGTTYARNENGQIICDENGYPTIAPEKDNYLGNREPLFSAGLSSTFNYKNLSLSFLLNGRLGGDVANITGRGLISMGQSKMLETYRGKQIVVDGVVKQSDGTYEANTTPITLDYTTITNYFYGVSENFIEDGSYIRLSYVTLVYSLPKKWLKQTKLTGVKASFTGNNLFLLTKYTGADPTLNANTSAHGTGSAGIDNYAVPSTKGFNFSLTASF